jgi:hypothetical protein
MWFRVALDKTEDLGDISKTPRGPSPSSVAGAQRDSAGVPIDLESHIEDKVEEARLKNLSEIEQARGRYESMKPEHRSLYDSQATDGVHPWDVDHEEWFKPIGERIESQTREWAEVSRDARQLLERVVESLREALPGAEVEPAGSFAKGTFFDKGPRVYDLDVHVEHADLPPSGGKTSVLLPDDFVSAVRSAEKAVGKPVDVFVTHEGKLWMMHGRSIVRKSGTFGASKGLTMRHPSNANGRAMRWDDFQRSFYRDLGRD